MTVTKFPKGRVLTALNAGGDMSEEETDDLFAEVKLLLDEIVVAPERPDRAAKAAVLLRILETALYGTTRTEEIGDESDEDDVDESGEDDVDESGEDDVDEIELLKDEIEALEAELATLRAYSDDLEHNAAVAAVLRPFRRAGELPWAPQ